VQPAPDRWDEGALDRYREMVRGLYDRGMTPLVTLHHFSEPLWVMERGGWENEGIADLFVEYVQKVVEALKEYVNLWATINEPNVLTAFAYLMGVFPPGKKDPLAAIRVMKNLVRAHARAYHAIHAIQKTARVGMALAYIGFQPAKGWSPLDRWAAGLQGILFNDFFPHAVKTGVLRFPAWFQRMPEAKGTQDYLGINYYTRCAITFNLLKAGELFGVRSFKPGSDLSETGWLANEPEGMFQAVRWGLQYGAPILITENGIEDSSDRIRPRYLTQHLHQLWRALNLNYPVKGYFHWTLVDNFEWERGWTQRFGLWELDVATQKRRKRPSADLYTEVCRENGISSEMVRRYAPEIFESMFPER
jgi:beta-glucosidase